MTNVPTTNDAGTSQPHAMSIPLQDLLDKAEGFIVAIDHIAGKQMESGPAGYYWGLALRLTGSTIPDSRLAGVSLPFVRSASRLLSLTRFLGCSRKPLQLSMEPLMKLCFRMKSLSM
jgi:hypothetical protein